MFDGAAPLQHEPFAAWTDAGVRQHEGALVPADPARRRDAARRADAGQEGREALASLPVRGHVKPAVENEALSAVRAARRAIHDSKRTFADLLIVGPASPGSDFALRAELTRRTKELDAPRTQLGKCEQDLQSSRRRLVTAKSHFAVLYINSRSQKNVCQKLEGSAQETEQELVATRNQAALSSRKSKNALDALKQRICECLEEIDNLKGTLWKSTRRFEVRLEKLQRINRQLLDKLTPADIRGSTTLH